MNLPIIFRSEARIFRYRSNTDDLESSDNLPICGPNLPTTNRQIIVRCPAGIVGFDERPTISQHRNLPIIYRFFARIYRLAESSDNRPTNRGNRPIRVPAAAANRQLIINRFAVIVNPASGPRL